MWLINLSEKLVSVSKTLILRRLQTHLVGRNPHLPHHDMFPTKMTQRHFFTLIRPNVNQELLSVRVTQTAAPSLSDCCRSCSRASDRLTVTHCCDDAMRWGNAVNQVLHENMHLTACDLKVCKSYDVLVNEPSGGVELSLNDTRQAFWGCVCIPGVIAQLHLDINHLPVARSGCYQASGVCRNQSTEV